MKSIESIDKTAKSIVSSDTIDYGVYLEWLQLIQQPTSNTNKELVTIRYEMLF